MTPIEVTAEKNSTGASTTATYNLGDTIPELVEQFGEEVVISHVKRSITIALQAFMRVQLDGGKSTEEIQAAVATWKPGVRKAAKTPIERAREEFQRMSPADRAMLIKELRQKKADETGIAA
jgi:hypothetical protein